MEFVLGKVALLQGFVGYSVFPCQFSIHHYFIYAQAMNSGSISGHGSKWRSLKPTEGLKKKKG